MAILAFLLSWVISEINNIIIINMVATDRVAILASDELGIASASSSDHEKSSDENSSRGVLTIYWYCQVQRPNHKVLWFSKTSALLQSKGLKIKT